MQFSYPWPGVKPTSGADAGRYSSEQWNAVWTAITRAGGMITDAGSTLLRTLAAWTNLGVFYSVGNQLEVTNPGAAVKTIQIDTGAALVEGQFYYNNIAVTLTVPINRTNDLIVLRRNYSAATYTPPASEDTDEVVPPLTTRITRVTALVQDTTRATYWDIPLADFTTDGAGVITLNSDDREWVDAETKQFLVPCAMSYDNTNSANLSQFASGAGVIMYNLSGGNPGESETGSSFYVPPTFLDDLVLSAIISPATAAGGDVYMTLTANYGAEGESPVTHTVNTTDTITLAPALQLYSELDVALVSAAVGDFVGVTITRDSANVADNYGSTLYVKGILVEYLGWR